MADLILDEGGNAILDEAGAGITSEALDAPDAGDTLPAMLHREAIEQLMPVKLAGTVHERDVALEGYHLDTVAASADDMVANAFADTAAALLVDWERVLGLRPAPAATLVDRRAANVAKIRARGGLSRRYFIELAAGMGFTIEIYEEPDWTWRVHVLSSPDFLNYFRAGESCAGDYLLDFGTPALEEMIVDLKPAHTFVYFSYA
ncbi:MAG: DUF2313 domain-containing protein [Desulfobacterales bacterium]|nr:DUF2313 domain-containing protein [Desulfobacterales bacterium]